jgi:hypothetical protein
MWSSYRLTPIPTDAPPFVVLGGPHVPMRVISYIASRAHTIELDERWAIDVTHVAASPGTRYAPGELAVYVGYRGQVWWAPSPILHVKGKRGGSLELTTLRDQSNEPLERADVDDFDSALAGAVLAHAGDLPDALKRAVRDLWGLDVWCPNCAGIGNPIFWGMPAGDPNQLTDGDGNLRPWPAGSYDVAGCSLDGADPAYACPRCGRRWGGQAAVAHREGIALTFADLLTLTGCVNVGQLEERISDYADLDTFLDFEDHPDPNVGFVVGVNTLGTELTFPLPVRELWEAVDRMEDQIREMWELEEQSDASQPDLPVTDHQVEPSIASE